jgi:hypothetical protein
VHFCFLSQLVSGNFCFQGFQSQQTQEELYEIQQKNCQDDLDNTKKHEYKQAEIIEELKALEISKEELTAERKEHLYKIALKNMPDHKRYNQLSGQECLRYGGYCCCLY